MSDLLAQAVWSDSRETWENANEADRARCRRIARAVVKAMREPTEVQYDALCATDKLWRELDSKTVWQTYIDALLA